MINDLGLQVHETAPDADTLMLAESENSDDIALEQACSNAISSEFSDSASINVSASGAVSWTCSPRSLIIPIISSTWSGSEISSGKWSFTSAYVRYPCSLPFSISSAILEL